jgi:hypothetical protein
MRKLAILYFLISSFVLGFKSCMVIGSGAHSLTPVSSWIESQWSQALIAGDPEKARHFTALSGEFFDRLVLISNEGFQASMLLGITSLLHFCIAAGLLVQARIQRSVISKQPNKALEPTPTSVTDRAAHAPRQP